MNAKDYNCVLKTAFPYFKNVFGNLEWHFQHDNAPSDTARSVKISIQSENLKVLEWPPYSPDLNIIENVWGWLAGKVYEGGKQYATKEELITGIKFARSTITLDYLKKIYD